MSRKKRKALFKRFRLLTVSEEEKRRNITASVMETARKQRETVYGIKAEENAPAGTEAAETIETSEFVKRVYYDIESGYPRNYSDVREVKRIALYFPNNAESFEREDYAITGSYDEDRIVTNSTGNEPLNAFLEKYPHILQLYKNNDLTREAYDAVVESFLSQLDDSEDIPF